MKSIYYIIICLLIFSCNSQKASLQSENDHLILKNVLNKVYKNNQKNKSKNLEIYTRQINDNDLKAYIKTIKLIDKADETIYIDSTWFNDFSEIDSDFGPWNPSLLNIENLNTEFELKEDENKELLDSITKEKKIEKKEQYKEKVILWVKENRTFYIVSATPVFYSKNRKKAMIFTSIYNAGLTAWLLENHNDQWKIISHLDVAVY